MAARGRTAWRCGVDGVRGSRGGGAPVVAVKVPDGQGRHGGDLGVEACGGGHRR
ncbi:hypothetical protein ACP70R_001513 [Stipagrostis hirtigluma subsp. patula]